MLLARRAKRRGRLWLLWFLLAIAGPVLAVLWAAFELDELGYSGPLHSVIMGLSPLRSVSVPWGGTVGVWVSPFPVVVLYLITEWIRDRWLSWRGYQWCPECNTLLSPGAWYCAQCGYGRDETMAPEQV